MHYVIVGNDTKEHTSWMLHGIYSEISRAKTMCEVNQVREIHPDRYTYNVVEIHAKEMDLFTYYRTPVEYGKPLIDVNTLYPKGVPAIANIRLQVSNLTAEEHSQIEFTNIPMERVHAAIGVLNGDDWKQPAMDRDSLNEWRRNAPYPVEESTGDFTAKELFDLNRYFHIKISPGGETTSLFECRECGAAVFTRSTHIDWHNKLLP